MPLTIGPYHTQGIPHTSLTDWGERYAVSKDMVRDNLHRCVCWFVGVCGQDDRTHGWSQRRAYARAGAEALVLGKGRIWT
jgi:hypothetical protein